MLKSGIHLFPLSLPDELHASQASRYHKDSGNNATQVTYEELYGTRPFCVTSWIPRNLERFAQKLDGSPSQNVERLLRCNTLFPLFETFKHAQLVLADNAQPIADQILNMPKRIVGESGKVQLCIDCLRADLEEHGTPILHRSHQIPGAGICSRHSTPLLQVCPFCQHPFALRKDLVLAHLLPCPGCRQYLLDAPFYNPDHRIDPREVAYAKFAHDLLQSATKPISAGALVHLYATRAAEFGFARGKQLSRAAIWEALIAHFGLDLVTKLDHAHRKGRTQHWLRMFVATEVHDVPLPRHLMVAQFLFGTVDEFWKAAEVSIASTTENCSDDVRDGKRPQPNRAEPGRPSTEAQRGKHAEPKHETESAIKQEIVKLVLIDSTLTIHDLWRKNKRLMKKLLKQHPDGIDWLSSILETAASATRTQSSVQRTSEQSKKDMTWANAFSSAAISLYSSIDKPVRVTRNHLMRTANWLHPNMPDRDKFPLARKQLETLFESDWHFYARRLVWAQLTLGSGNVSSHCLVRTAGLEWHRGKVLADFFSELPNDLVLIIGAVQDILKNRGIPKLWTGPVPHQEFYPAGRSYTRRVISNRARKRAPSGAGRSTTEQSVVQHATSL